MSRMTLEAEVRTTSGKEKAKKLRKTGKCPAVVYGLDRDPVSLTLDTHQMEFLLAQTHGEKVLVDLSYASSLDPVFVRNVQRDPVQEKLLHVDFYRVDMNRALDTSVPVVSVGVPFGVKEGGVLDHVLYEVQIRCLPQNVPPRLSVNVEDLRVGQSVHVRDLPPIPAVQILTSPDAVLFAVHGKMAEEEAKPVAQAAPEEGAPAADQEAKQEES